MSAKESCKKEVKNLIEQLEKLKTKYENAIRVAIQVMKVYFDSTLNQVELLCPIMKIPRDKFHTEKKVFAGKLATLVQNLDT